MMLWWGVVNTRARGPTCTERPGRNSQTVLTLSRLANGKKHTANRNHSQQNGGSVGKKGRQMLNSQDEEAKNNLTKSGSGVLITTEETGEVLGNLRAGQMCVADDRPLNE